MHSILSENIRFLINLLIFYICGYILTDVLNNPPRQHIPDYQIMKIPFPTIPIGINWRDEAAAAFAAYRSESMQQFIQTWNPYALITFDNLPPESVTPSHFNDLLHRFLLDLDPTHPYRRNRGDEYNDGWNEEGRLSFISYGDGFVHEGFKLRAYSHRHDNNVGGWTGILFANHTDMRSQVYAVVRLAYEFSLWLQKQRIEHSIKLLKCDTGIIDVDLPPLHQ
jgi:hypothetical protein